MSRRHLFVTDSGTGNTTRIPGDPAHLDRQVREHRAAGREVTVLDDDEQIRFGLLAQRIADAHRQGNL